MPPYFFDDESFCVHFDSASACKPLIYVAYKRNCMGAGHVRLVEYSMPRLVCFICSIVSIHADCRN